VGTLQHTLLVQLFNSSVGLFLGFVQDERISGRLVVEPLGQVDIQALEGNRVRSRKPIY
jgi:hypothetical protein